MRPLLLVLALSLSGCITDGEGPAPQRGNQGRETGGEAEEPRQLLPVPTQPNFVLYVSNQSFEIDPVDIDVFVDGELAVEGDFLVGSQHTWHMFEFELAPGEHTIRAVTSAGDTRLSDTVDITDQTRYAVVNFWYYEGHEPYGPTFSLNLFDDPPGFD
jgi:hypothetical protein